MRLLLLFVAGLLFPLLVPAAEEDSPQSPAVDYFIRGTVASEMDDHFQAVFYFQEALREDSSSTYIYVALAQEYLYINKPARALETLDTALQIESGKVEALELKADILRSLGRYRQAIEALERLVQISPDEHRYHYELLFGYLAIEEFDKADEIYSRYIRGKSDVVPLLRQVLSVYVLAREFDRAVPYMQQLLDSDSADASMIYSMGTLYLQVGDTLLADSLIHRAIEMNPAEPNYWFAAAVIAFERSDLERVIELSDSAESLAGSTPNMCNLRGNCFQRQGNTSAAIESFSKAIELDSTYFAALGSLALIYDGLDSLDQVVALYERAIRLSDSAAVYMNNLAYTFAERGIELERAEKLVTLALELEPENASYLDTMGWIKFQAGEYEEAVDWLKRAVKYDSESAPLYEHLGDTYLKLNKESTARKYYKRGLQRDPQNEALLQKLGQN